MASSSCPPSTAQKYTKTIFDYIKEARVEELESCVKRGTSVNEVEKTKDKFTPLHSACYYGSLECLHWLLWQEADTTMTTPKGWTPAHIAAIRGQYACIQALIKNGANMNARDNRGQTAAHLACTHGHSQTLQAILKSGADINLQDANGWTPVHAAAYHGRLGCLQFLKTAGGKLDECDNDGNTPAHLAAMEGNLHCLKYIISNAHNMNNLITARNDQGDTPKTLAQQFYKDAVVEYLEAVEWDRDHPEQAENLAFPAHVAAYNGDLEHIKLLVEQGVVNINERDDKGSTMAHKAAGQGHLRVLQWLIENGADLKIVNQSGESARDVAKRFAQLACIKILEYEVGSDDEDSYEKADLNGHTEAKDPILLSSQQKKEAKTRAKKRVEDCVKQLTIAQSNYLQLGGKLDEAVREEIKTEQLTLKTINELQNELEFERLKREKLEAQLDHTRQELEKALKSLTDYETKLIVLERYIQCTAKMDAKGGGGGGGKKRPAGSTGAGSKIPPARPRSQTGKSASSSSGGREDRSSGFLLRRNSQSNKSNSETSVRSAVGHDILKSLTNSQMRELRRAFDEIDTNGSGSISRKELKRAFKDLDIRSSDDEIEVVINQMDTNHDGKIDFEEFARVMARNYYRKRSKEEVREAFRKYDLNNSGYISAEELRVVLSKMHRFYTREEIENMIRKVDRNKDGLIGIDEFTDLLKFEDL